MFTGYSGETLDFLWGIRFNNERSWFLAHKEEYLRCLYQPTMELGAQARVKGNLHYGLIETAMGAQIEGRLCPMTEASPRPLELPASVETVD